MALVVSTQLLWQTTTVLTTINFSVCIFFIFCQQFFLHLLSTDVVIFVDVPQRYQIICIRVLIVKLDKLSRFQ